MRKEIRFSLMIIRPNLLSVMKTLYSIKES